MAWKLPSHNSFLLDNFSRWCILLFIIQHRFESGTQIIDNSPGAWQSEIHICYPWYDGTGPTAWTVGWEVDTFIIWRSVFIGAGGICANPSQTNLSVNNVMAERGRAVRGRACTVGVVQHSRRERRPTIVRGATRVNKLYLPHHDTAWQNFNGCGKCAFTLRSICQMVFLIFITRLECSDVCYILNEMMNTSKWGGFLV